MEKYVITISRRFSSGGHEIARRMGELLGIPVYDRSAVEARMQSEAPDPDLLPEKPQSTGEEKEASHPAKDLLRSLFRREAQEEADIEAKREYERQCAVMRALAAEGSCIIIGRCGDQVFRDHARSMHVFIYASTKQRIRNSMELLHTGEEEAAALIAAEDRAREAYRKQFCESPDNEVDGRNILIDSGKFGVEATARLLADAARELFLSDN